MKAPSTYVLGIDPKLYRHFAAVTLIISASVAMFADGHNRREIAQNIAERQQRIALERQSRAKFGAKKIGSEPKVTGHWGQPAGPSGFDSPGDGGGSYDAGYAPSGRAGTWGPQSVRIELDPAMLARMSPAQRAAFLKKMEEERKKRIAQGPAVPTQAQLANLLAASAQRSGSNADDNGDFGA